MELKENLKYLREKMGLSQKEFAEKMSLSQSLISHIEQGIKIPSLLVVIQIAELLEVSIDTLINEKLY